MLAYLGRPDPLSTSLLSLLCRAAARRRHETRSNPDESAIKSTRLGFQTSPALVRGPARAEHDRIIDEAEALGVFGVPTMVFNGELFWGSNRIDMLIERIGSYIERESIQAD
jgi:2-hydroxychromene-2-carboxylate isomerase